MKNEMKDYSRYKVLMRMMGIPLLGIGFLLIVNTFFNFGTNSLIEARSQMNMFALGSFMVFIGFWLVRVSLTRPVSEYYATELSPATELTGRSIWKGLYQSDFGRSEPKEIIKIRCSYCGYIETNDARFCSKCGNKI